MKELHLKFIPTGNVFTMPEDEALEFLKKDRGNYEITDEDYNVPQEPEVKETSVYQQVVDEVKTFDEYSYKELKEFAKENNLSTKGNTEELRKRCFEYSKTLGQ